MVRPYDPVPAAQIILDLAQEGSGHLRISHGPVGAAGFGQAVVVDQHAELVAGGLGIQPSGDQHGAGEGLGRYCLAGQAEFGFPEAAVKGGVVGHHGGVADKALGFPHHGVGRGRGGDHGVADAGQAFDEGRDVAAGVHEALEAVDDLAVLDQHDGDFGGAVAHRGREACGFEVDDGDAGAHGLLLLSL